MKKRAMKKWIPRNTLYCYKCARTETGSIVKLKICPWWRKNYKASEQESGYCMYLNKGDWQEDYSSTLWDMCKECEIGEDN